MSEKSTKSHELVQVLFTAITARGVPLEKREYFWEMHQLGQMVRVADSMANENENVVRLVIDIALPQ